MLMDCIQNSFISTFILKFYRQKKNCKNFPQFGFARTLTQTYYKANF